MHAGFDLCDSVEIGSLVSDHTTTQHTLEQRYTMICYCSRCYPFKIRSLPVVRQHLKSDRVLLRTIEHTLTAYSELEQCISLTEDSIRSEGNSTIISLDQILICFA